MFAQFKIVGSVGLGYPRESVGYPREVAGGGLVGGGPFQKNKSYPHFLMLWSLYNRYLTLKMVSLQN